MDLELKKEHIPFIILIMLAVAFMILAFNTPMLGEDEGAYFYMSKLFSELKYPAFISPVQPLNYPPLLPLMSATVFTIFGLAISVAKILVCTFGILTIFLLYIIGSKINWIFGLVAASILLSISVFTHYMLLFYVDVPIAFFSLLSMYMFINVKSSKKAVVIGAVLSLAFFMKVSAVLLPLSFLIYALYMKLIKKDGKYFKYSIIAFFVFTVLVSPFIIRNIILYNYPYVDGLNSFFGQSSNVPQWIVESTDAISQNIDIMSVFGLLALLFGVFGIVYFILSKDEKIALPILIFGLFLLMYFVRTLLNIGIGDSRYFSIVFPQLALIGGYFAVKVYEWNKKSLPIFIAVIAICIVLSFMSTIGTSSSTRYTVNYVQALEWIKQNTAHDSIIFTAYGGSLEMFGGRVNVWTIDEFPKIMTTNDSTYIYNTLKSYNTSYILLWNGILADRYIIPESNLLGAFTYNFVNIINNDAIHFNKTYENQECIIWKLEM